MTNTAQVLDRHEYRDTGSQGKGELLSAWLYNQDHKVSPGCLLVDISKRGCAILIPRHQPIPDNTFDLVIMSSDENNKGEILTILESEQRWVNRQHSDAHIKMGLEFLNINPTKLLVIDTLIQLLVQGTAPAELA